MLEAPQVIVVEAKKNDFEQGWGQCLAELVAAQRINQDAERSVYGVVTDGNLWQFGRIFLPRIPRISRLTALLGCMELWSIWLIWSSKTSRADADSCGEALLALSF